MIQFIVVSSFLLQDYISSILLLVFSCWVCPPGVAVSFKRYFLQQLFINYYFKRFIILHLFYIIYYIRIEFIFIWKAICHSAVSLIIFFYIYIYIIFSNKLWFYFLILLSIGFRIWRSSSCTRSTFQLYLLSELFLWQALLLSLYNVLYHLRIHSFYIWDLI